MRRRATLDMFTGGINTPAAQPILDPEKQAKAEFWRGLAEAARKRGDANDYALAQAMLNPGGGSQPQQHPTLPQPATVQDTIALSKEAREAAAAQSRIALETAEQEHKRRVEAEEEAQQAYGAGASSEAEKWGVLLGIVQENNKAIIEMMRTNHTSQVEAIQAQSKEILERLEERFNTTISFKDQEVQRHQEAAKFLKAELDKQKSSYEQIMEAIYKNDPNHPAVAFYQKFHAPRSGEKSHDERWKDFLLEEEMEKARRSRAKADKEESRADEEHKERVELLRSGRKILEENVGGFLSLLVNSVGSKPPESEL